MEVKSRCCGAGRKGWSRPVRVALGHQHDWQLVQHQTQPQGKTLHSASRAVILKRDGSPVWLPTSLHGFGLLSGARSSSPDLAREQTCPALIRSLTGCCQTNRLMEQSLPLLRGRKQPLARPPSLHTEEGGVRQALPSPPWEEQLQWQTRPLGHAHPPGSELPPPPLRQCCQQLHLVLFHHLL